MKNQIYADAHQRAFICESLGFVETAKALRSIASGLQKIDQEKTRDVEVTFQDARPVFTDS